MLGAAMLLGSMVLLDYLSANALVVHITFFAAAKNHHRSSFSSSASVRCKEAIANYLHDCVSFCVPPPPPLGRPTGRS